MSEGKKFFWYEVCAFAFVFAQPIFGFNAIPEFFHYNMGAAAALGFADVIILFFPVGVLLYREL